MDKKYLCQCGKEFASCQGLAGHVRRCEEKKHADVNETYADEERSGKLNAGTRDVNHVKDITIGNNQNFDEAEAEEDAEDTVVHYRCVRCYGLFATVEAYQEHYMVEHLGIDSASIKEQSAGTCSTVLPAAEPDSESRGFCKRCRGRILSSSEDDEEVNEWPSKKQKRAGTGLATGSMSPPPSNHIPKEAILSASGMSRSYSDALLNAGANDTATRPHQLGISSFASSQLSSPSSGMSKHDYDEIMNNLLKDANALSKVYKIVILNFFAGRRVNPDPAKGPIQVIRLGEKFEMAKSDDGSETAVLRESFVKLNFDTGEWEKIVKAKKVDTLVSSNPQK